MDMVEVFKTNVQNHEQANRLSRYIHENLAGCEVNFDLDDCDHVLRIKFFTESIPSGDVVRLLNESGFEAEVLPDHIPPFIGNELLMSAT